VVYLDNEKIKDKKAWITASLLMQTIMLGVLALAFLVSDQIIACLISLGLALWRADLIG